MVNNMQRDDAYINKLKDFIRAQYQLEPLSITPAKRGYYGETWRMDTADSSYFLKLDYFPRHQETYKHSLPVIEYLRNNGIDFISAVVKTASGELCANFNSAVLAVFEWIDGETSRQTKQKRRNIKCCARFTRSQSRGLISRL